MTEMTRMTTPAIPDPFTVLSDPNQAPILAQRRKRGGCTLSQGRSHICLNADELARLVEWVQAGHHNPVKWTTTTPAKARLMRYPVVKPDANDAAQ